MSVCDSRTGVCPAIAAMNHIKGGGYTVATRRKTIITGGVATTHTVSEAAFHAALAKMELARDEMKGRRYEGILRQLAGQSRTLGVCYLIGSRNLAIRRALRDITDDVTAIDASCIYPSALYDTVVEIAKSRGFKDQPPKPPTVNVADIGTFAPLTSVSPSKEDGDVWEALHVIADDLLEVSKLCADIEAYQLEIVGYLASEALRPSLAVRAPSFAPLTSPKAM